MTNINLKEDIISRKYFTLTIIFIYLLEAFSLVARDLHLTFINHICHSYIKTV